MRSHLSRYLLPLLVLASLSPLDSFASVGVQLGEVIENDDLTTLDGKTHPVMGKALSNVIVFVRTDNAHSSDLLKTLAELEREFAGKSVSWVAVVSDREPLDPVREMVKESGIQMPVLVDKDDELYGKIHVRLHPSVLMADEKHKLQFYEPSRQINYGNLLRARVRFMLHEISEAQMDQVLAPERADLPNSEASRARRYVNMGKRALTEKRVDRALTYALKAMEKDAALASARTLAGRAYAAKGECALALESFDQALSLDPRDEVAAEGKKSCGATAGK